MKLEKLIGGITANYIIGDTSIEITGINIDSRLIEEGHVFVAVKGTQTDGHVYIEKAIEKGASAIVCETIPANITDHITYIQVPNSEDIVGELATLYYDDPTSQLELVGVTGTNGKTTIATLLYNMFRKFGYKVGLISTVCNYIDNEPIPTSHTTPDPITLNKLLGRMADEGCKYVFMEVSSHSVAQKRIGGLKFAGGIFTNLTRDHLDYHKTVDNYLKAKKAFFDNLPDSAFALTNADDKNGLVMTQNTKAHVYTYSTRSMADFRGKILEEGFEGMLLRIQSIVGAVDTEVFVPLVGRFNVSNLLLIYGCAVAMGVDAMEVLRILSGLAPVNGRFETIRSPKGWTAVIDYAHTPDAVENVLKTINEIVAANKQTDSAQVITVVGCGGNRDKGKRPMMARIAYDHSTQLILTSDNPRDEEAKDILQDMAAGLTNEELQRVLIIEDRASAIKTACTLARHGDAILVAGKGHEDYQIIKGVKYHFDDHEVVRGCL